MKKIVDSLVFELLVVSILPWEALQAEEYVIIQRKRSINTGTTLKAQPDRFTISSSLCTDDGSAQCQEMRASRISNCTCECNRATSGDLTFSTFGLGQNGRWTCLENAEVHERLGCLIILNNWANDSAPVTVPNIGIGEYEIRKQFRNLHIYRPTSKAQQCDGSWMDLNYDTYVKKRFSVQKRENKEYLQFNYSGNSSSQAGRIIRLGVGYYSASPDNIIAHTCVLLKMEGKIQCPFSLPPTATPPTTETVFLSTTFKRILSTATVRSTRSYPHISRSSGPSTVTMPTGKTSNPMVVNTNTQNTSSDDHTTGMIAGAVAGVIGLIALVIVMVLVRKRKKRNTIEKRTDVTAAENIGYGTNRAQQSLDDQEEYSYAYASVVSINKQDQQPRNKGTQNAENASNSPANTGHILKGHEYATVNKAASRRPADEHHEPLYRVLEGPETEGPDVNEPPCYHVLEGPHPDSGPFYDVLEEPKSSAPFPNQDNTRPTVKPEVAVNRGYNDTVYDSVEEIIPDTRDIYEQLNQDRQSVPGVYQALTYGNQPIPLTKLNATHSEV